MMSENIMLYVNGENYETLPSKKHLMKTPLRIKNIKEIRAVLPCTIKDIFVKAGQDVKRGDKLLIFESMKMANELRAEIDGRIKSINVNTGERVTKSTLLVEFE